MTIEEKMDHFKNVSLENASAQSNEILEAYKKSLEEQFEQHKVTAKADCETLENAKLNAVKTNAKKELLKVQTEYKHKMTAYQNKLKSQIFAEVTAELEKYKMTEAYKNLLIKQIKSISEDFKDIDVTFYIDPSDTGLLAELIKITGADIQISTIPFIGGLKAIITSRNMLVDNSFKTKLADEQEQFSISF